MNTIIVTEKDIARAVSCTSQAKAEAQINAIKDPEKMLCRGLAFIEHGTFGNESNLWRDAAKKVGATSLQIMEFDKAVRVFDDAKVGIVHGDILRAIKPIRETIKELYVIPINEISRTYRKIETSLYDLCEPNYGVVSSFIQKLKVNNVKGFTFRRDGNWNPQLTVLVGGEENKWFSGTSVEVSCKWEEGKLRFVNYYYTQTKEQIMPSTVEEDIKKWLELMNEEAVKENLLDLIEFMYLRPSLYRIHFLPQKLRAQKVLNDVTEYGPEITINSLHYSSLEVGSTGRYGFDRRNPGNRIVYDILKKINPKLVKWSQCGPHYPKTPVVNIEVLLKIHKEKYEKDLVN